MTDSSLYIGLMSGTSADGIDLALVDVASGKAELVASAYYPYNAELHQQITALYQPGSNELDRAGHLDIQLARQFADAITQFLAQQQLSPADICAIGNHGQTIRHRPDQHHAFTLQIGCSQTLATLTGIRVIGQFRRKDMALGGQGAPLVPAFHRELFAESDQDVFIVNIGGIANLTHLPAQHSTQAISGFDTGPGNALLDVWFQQHHHNAGNFDAQGQWASTGTVKPQLLASMLKDEYFTRPAPKSTGREYFHLSWLQQHLTADITACDVQATLCALTTVSITDAISNIAGSGKVYLFGGGVHNKLMLAQLAQRLTNYQITSTMNGDVTSDNLEAMAFAWLAFAYDKKIYGNVPAVTGASAPAVLGSLFTP